MTTREKIEKLGFHVTSNMSYKNGIQSIISYTAKKNNSSYTSRTITGLYNLLRNK